MKVFYITPTGKKTPGLFDTIPFDKTENITNADVVFYDHFSGLGTYDDSLIEFAVSKRLPIVVFDETDFGGMSKEIWDKNRQWRTISKKQPIIYFLRKMNKTFEYPRWVYPYEKIIESYFPLTTSDELFSRPNEIFFYGNTSPQRISVCNELQQHFICEFSLGQEKIPHNEWLNKARNAKLFLTADGGGFTDERPYQLITISPMLKQINNQLLVHEWTNGINCLKISEQPTEGEINFLKSVLNDKEWLHTIYINGVNYMEENYSAESRAKYILSILKQEGIC